MRERITFTVDPFWAAALRRGAEKSGTTLSAYVEKSLRSELIRQAAEQEAAWYAEHHPTFFEDAAAERLAAEQVEAERRAS